mmetsp:Transcript_19346/g.48379  ORF Transcript_19346/g.48379 Transcript_19346/m.48379 type:complete len:220 (-) Transcript_19346:2759-3418(-)
MWRDRVDVGFPFLIIATVDRLSCSRMSPRAGLPMDSSSLIVQIPWPIMSLAPTSSASVDAFVTMRCLTLVTCVAPLPSDTAAPVWLFPSWCTPYDASTLNVTNRSSRAPRVSFRFFVALRYLSTRESFCSSCCVGACTREHKKIVDVRRSPRVSFPRYRSLAAREWNASHRSSSSHADSSSISNKSSPAGVSALPVVSLSASSDSTNAGMLMFTSPGVS